MCLACGFRDFCLVNILWVKKNSWNLCAFIRQVKILYVLWVLTLLLPSLSFSLFRYTFMVCLWKVEFVAVEFWIIVSVGAMMILSLPLPLIAIFIVFSQFEISRSCRCSIYLVKNTKLWWGFSFLNWFVSVEPFCFNNLGFWKEQFSIFSILWLLMKSKNIILPVTGKHHRLLIP